MRSWMTGVVLGVLPVALWPRLPGWQFSLLLALAALLAKWLSPGRVTTVFSGLALGCALAMAYGQNLLRDRLPREA